MHSRFTLPAGIAFAAIAVGMIIGPPNCQDSSIDEGVGDQATHPTNSRAKDPAHLASADVRGRTAVRQSAGQFASTTDEHAGDLFGAIDSCLSDYENPDIQRSCVADALLPGGVPTPKDLGKWLCREPDNFPIMRARALVVAEILMQIQPIDALEYLDSMQSECARYRETDFLKNCFTHIKSVFPEWYAGWERTITPESAFAQYRGQVAVQLLPLLAEDGNPYGRYLLEEGGRGYFGGSADQILRAASISLKYQTPGKEFRDYLVSVHDSPLVPNEEIMGGFFVNWLSSKSARADGNWQHALKAINTVLDDARFGENAAFRLLHYDRKAREEAMPAEAKESWRAIMTKAAALLDR